MTKMNGLSKKMLSLVTVICMLGALITVPASAEVTSGAADLIYFNDFSDINTISFDDRGTEKTTYGKIDADTEGGHSSIYKHYMTTGTGRQTFMTSALPVTTAISGKKLGISFQLKFDISEADAARLTPYFFLDANSGRVSGDASVLENTLFHILPGAGYYVGGAQGQRSLLSTEDLKLYEWNRFDIEIDQTSSPMTGKVYANGTLCATVTYPTDAAPIERFIISSFTYDKSLENATRDTVNHLTMIDNFKVYEIDENDTFGFVATETKDGAIYAELGGTVSEIPSGITVKKVGTNAKTAVSAQLVDGHMIKMDLSGVALDAGAEYMIEVPAGMTDMYGRSFDDVLLFNAPAGEANIYYNEFDSADGIIANYTKSAEVRSVAETITGHGNVLEAYSTAEVTNMTWTPYVWRTVELGKTISSGKVSLSFDYMFNLPDDDNTTTTQVFNLDVYLANTTTNPETGEKSVSYLSAPIFQFIPGSATDWILQSKSTSGNVRWRPSRTDYAITENYHTIKVELDKTNETAFIYDNNLSFTGTTAFNLADGLKGSFDSVMFVLYSNLNNYSACDSFTTRIDNLRVWETAPAMDLRVINTDDTEALPEAEIGNAFKGFKAYFESAASPVVSLKNNTDNESVTVTATPNASSTEYTITLSEFLEAEKSYTLTVGTHKYNFTTTDSGMTISGFGVYKANGDLVDEFSDVTVGETLTAKATVYNGGGKNICISYGVFGGKFMKAFDFTQYEEVTGGILGTPVEIDIPVTADLAADEISVYLWNDLNSLTPYISCVEID